MQRVRDFVSNNNAATRYSEHKDIVPIGKLVQLFCQLPSGVFTVI